MELSATVETVPADWLDQCREESPSTCVMQREPVSPYKGALEQWTVKPQPRLQLALLFVMTIHNFRSPQVSTP